MPVQRVPALEKRINEVNASDIRVCILGTVVDAQNEVIMVDDGTGRIKVSFEKSANVKPKQLARIWGRVIAAESGVELQGEIFQDMSKLDLDLWKRVNRLWNKAIK